MTTPTILTVNAGSSSLKLGLFDRESLVRLDHASVEWRGGAQSDTERADGLRAFLAQRETSHLVAIGHRIVHGGIHLTSSRRIDDGVLAAVKALVPLAPLHNQAALDGIQATSIALPGVPHFASFDTAFHATLPPTAYRYAVPNGWYEQFGIRRLGFHGLSHAYCSGRAREMLGEEQTHRIVTCHLGQGASLAAVLDGKSMATTMGFTPMDGIMMGTRSGAIDPGVIPYLIDQCGFQLTDLFDAMNHDAGLLGVSGVSGDMREIESARADGHAGGILAFDLFIARLCEGIATMAVALQGLDALVFTAGIGENSPLVREKVAERLAWTGVRIDPTANAAVSGAHEDTDITHSDTFIKVLVIHTQEDLMVARETNALLDQ